MKKLSFQKERLNILLLENIHPHAREVFEREGYTQIREVKASLSGEALREALADVHFLGIRSRTRVTDEVIAAAPKLFAIGCFCIGTDQVDLDAAAHRGVPVFNAPFSNTRSVAELVLAEMILLMRRVPDKSVLLHAGGWSKSAEGSYEVRGKTLGIVGYGNIGTQIGILAEQLGMRVGFFDVTGKLPLGNARQMSTLGQLLADSDIVTLHVPDTPETRGMIGAAELAAMKRGAILLNASRGTVVDLEALAAALRSGHIGGAAIDVFPKEPSSNDERFVTPLQGLPNVILTPHIGGSTAEAQANIGIEVAEKLVHYSDNGSTVTAVNFPEVSLPEHAGEDRLLHIHRNVPGVLAHLNEQFSRHGVNVSGQYLQTQGEIGYCVTDVATKIGDAALDELRAIPGTIRCRVLHAA